MMKKDLIGLWEVDGDLELMRSFFKRISPDSDKKEHIKKMVLQKIAQQEALNLPIEVEEEKDTIFSRLRSTCQSVGNWWKWKWPVAALTLIMLVVLGQNLYSGGHPVNIKSFSDLSSISQSKAATEAQPQNIVRGSAADASQNSVAATKEVLPKVATGLPPQPSVPPADEGLPRKITHTLNITLQVEKVEAAVEQLIQEVNKLGGYVVESRQDSFQKNSSGYVTLKVPSDKFDGLQALLPQFGKILNQHISTNDITNQYYDAQTRLTHWEAEEKRYLEFLQQAKTIDDIMKIEGALSNIRLQIEQLKGQLKLWNHEVAYSTVQIQLQTTPDKVTVNDPWQPVSWSKTWQAAKNAVLKTISTTWNFLNYLVVGLAYIFPFLILVVLAWLAYRFWRRAKTPRGKE